MPDAPSPIAFEAPLVMLDLDGTLVESRSMYTVGVPLIVKRGLGLEIGLDDFIDLWGLDVRRCFSRFVARAGQPPDRVKDLYEDFETWYIANHAARVHPYPGVAEGLRRMRAHGVRLGVVTTRTQRRAQLLNDFAWGRWIDFVVGGDRVTRHKPHPDSLDYAIAHHGAGARRFVYLGDNPSDMQAAQGSRHAILCAAALWGAENPQALKACQPDLVFESFDAFSRWVVARSDEPGPDDGCDAQAARAALNGERRRGLP
jgi:HAD superfamily hydrolase (TIGR01549 family)